MRIPFQHARPHSVRQADGLPPLTPRLPRVLPLAPTFGSIDSLETITTRDSGAVATIVNQLEEHPYRFAQDYLNLRAFVKQLHARVEQLEKTPRPDPALALVSVDREIL